MSDAELVEVVKVGEAKDQGRKEDDAREARAGQQEQGDSGRAEEALLGDGALGHERRRSATQDMGARGGEGEVRTYSDHVPPGWPVGADVPQRLEAQPLSPDAIDDEAFIKGSGEEQGGEKEGPASLEQADGPVAHEVHGGGKLAVAGRESPGCRAGLGTGGGAGG